MPYPTWHAEVWPELHRRGVVLVVCQESDTPPIMAGTIYRRPGATCWVCEGETYPSAPFPRRISSGSQGGGSMRVRLIRELMDRAKMYGAGRLVVDGRGFRRSGGRQDHWLPEVSTGLEVLGHERRASE